ncbi:MAG: DnaD domain protein [Bacilli bacterium]|jgi:DNA replication protein|nr:DnaD domain protein [Bacilli bacterium]MCH4210946.1 DnaD domain protein [Bacilli bacterium]MCH4229072.1 DnaD domain protein [Bacilli bacterium]MCH4277776.1 DnaD domain protein [Bacilli bacterium]
MKKNAIYSAVSFRYAILDTYKKLQLSEMELLVILMIDHLLEQGNNLVTSDALSMKMNYSPDELDKCLVSLMKRGLLSYEKDSKGMKTSIDGAKNLVYGEFQKSIQNSQSALYSKDKSDRLSSLCKLFESKLERSLTPLESQTMGEWIESGYQDEDIKDALLDALNDKKKSLRYVDKILRNKRRDSDLEKEGTSLVSPTWDKDIEKTIEIAKAMWNDDPKK